jgi:hypothetical protein
MRFLGLGAGAALVGLSLAGAAPAERPLIRSPGLTATLDQPLRCDQPASVTVEAAHPDLLGPQSPELQRLMDAVHAMLAFECPNLPALEVHGVLRGLPDPIYRGTASARTSWLLQPEQVARSETSTPPAVQSPAPSPPPSPAEVAEGYAVAGLAPGMTVDEARAAISQAFGVTPEYQAQSGLMVMRAPQCPDGNPWRDPARPPRAGWKCLTAWFTDERIPRLYLLELTQVVENRGLGAVEGALTERFGAPAERKAGQPPWISAGGLGAVQLAWGDPVQPGAAFPQNAPRPSHVLEAAIEPVGNAIVTTVVLYGHSVASGAAGSPPGDIDLKL